MVATVLSLTAIVAYADREQGPKADRRGEGPGYSEWKLDLDDQQIEKMKALRLDTQKQLVPLRAEAQIAELELRKLLDEDPVNTSAVHEKVEAIGRLRTQIRTRMVDLGIEMRKLLTPEQRRKAGGWFFRGWEGRGPMHRGGGFDRPGPRWDRSDCPMSDD
jgi:Spy/CpxP family protein refolding chaperone